MLEQLKHSQVNKLVKTTDNTQYTYFTKVYSSLEKALVLLNS